MKVNNDKKTVLSFTYYFAILLLMKYVALLRGINVGGKKKVVMSDLKQMFEQLGFSDVTTLLNSGNVVFTTTNMTEVGDVKQKIEAQIIKTFGFTSQIIVRKDEEIQKIVEADPFKEIEITPDTRLYVSFLADKYPKLQIPYETPEKDMKILQVVQGAVCSVIQLSSDKGTVDLMSFIEKEFGKNSTTRNWNTVIKIHQALTS
jgi:uncharacterized protein (DUF1697 family)